MIFLWTDSYFNFYYEYLHEKDRYQYIAIVQHTNCGLRQILSHHE